MALENFSYLNFDYKIVEEELFKFFALRFEYILADKGIRYDVINAIMNLRNNSIIEKVYKADALNDWCDSDITAELTAFSRIANLSKGINSTKVDENLLCECSEKALWKIYKNFLEKFNIFVKDCKYFEALNMLKEIVPSINNLFDNVMIMDKNENIKNNRLALLNSIKVTIMELGDLSEIVYK